ncbi:hypothetical protein P8452_51879 [Trifolium repens]|nr:hypothetical protein P8452_51879 [Trifolium repens]
MAEQNKLEAFSDHPTPPNDPHHAIDLPNSIFVVSAPPPTHGSKVDVVEEKRLGFFGNGYGWDLFILGFFLLAIPWFIGSAIVVSIIMDSIQQATCTKCISTGADF